MYEHWTLNTQIHSRYDVILILHQHNHCQKHQAWNTWDSVTLRISWHSTSLSRDSLFRSTHQHDLHSNYHHQSQHHQCRFVYIFKKLFSGSKEAVFLSKVWTTGGLWQNRSSSFSTTVTPLFALCKMQIFDRKSSLGRPVGRQGAIWDDVFAIFDPHVFLNRFSSHKHVQMQINLNLFGKWRKV